MKPFAVFLVMVLVLVLAIAAAAASAILGLMESRADVVFLGTEGFAVVVMIIAEVLYCQFDKTNGNDSGLVATALAIIGNAIIVTIASVVTLFAGHALVVGLSACGIIVLWTGYLTYGLIR